MKLLNRIMCVATVLSAFAWFSAPTLAMTVELSPNDVFVDNSQLVVISSKRTGRTVKEFVLKANLINISDKNFENVEAILVGLPPGVKIVGTSVLNFGSLFGPDTYQSRNTITLEMNLRIRPNIRDLEWQVRGNEKVDPPPPPPPPPTPSPSEIGVFMSIDGNVIEGEVENESHNGWIKLLAWQQGVNALLTDFATQRNLNSVFYSDVSVTKFLDQTSTQLRSALTNGTQFEEIKIDVIAQCDGNLYTQYAMTLVDGIFSSVTSSPSKGADKIVESLSIDITRLESIYVPVDEECRLQQPIFSYQDMTF